MSTSSAKSFRGPPLHLLVFAYKQRLSGSVVADDGRREHVIHFVDGAPAKVATDGHIAPLLDVLDRLGLADPDALELERGTSVTPEDGWSLVDRGLIDDAALMTARRWQVMRRLEHVLNRPASTRYSVYEGEDLAAARGEEDLAAVDPLAVIMQGSRLLSSRDVIDTNVERYTELRLTTRRGSKHDRLRLSPHEEAVVAALEVEPRRLAELVKMGHDEETARRVLFGLIVSQGLARAADQQAGDSHPPPSSHEPASSAPEHAARVPVASSPGVPVATFSVPPVSVMPAAPSHPPLVAARPSAHPWPLDSAPAPTLPDGLSDGSAILVDPDEPEPEALHQRPTPKRPPPVPNAERFAFASRALRQGPVPVIGSGAVEVQSEPPEALEAAGGATSSSPPAGPRAPSPRAGYGPTGTLPPGIHEELRPSGPPGDPRSRGRFGTDPAPVSDRPPSSPPRRAARPATPPPAPDAYVDPFHPGAEALPPPGPAMISRPGEVVSPEEAPPLPGSGLAASGPPRTSSPDRASSLVSRPSDAAPSAPSLASAPSHPSAAAPASLPPSADPFAGMGRVEVPDDVRDRAMAHFFAAEEALKILDRDRAEQELDQASALIPGEARFEVLRLWIEAERLGLPASDQLAKERHYQRQLAALDAICEHAPRLEEAFYYRGRLLKRSGRLKEAITDFKHAGKLNPSNLDAAREVRDYEDRVNRRRKKSGEEEVPSNKKLRGIRSEAENKVAEVADFFKGVLRRRS